MIVIQNYTTYVGRLKKKTCYCKSTYQAIVLLLMKYLPMATAYYHLMTFLSYVLYIINVSSPSEEILLKFFICLRITIINIIRHT